jgi:hypothetical protein
MMPPIKMKHIKKIDRLALENRDLCFKKDFVALAIRVLYLIPDGLNLN